MARPVGKWFMQSGTSASGLCNPEPEQSAATYPASEQCFRPRWRSAQLGPHNHSGLKGPFVVSGFRAAVRLSGHLASTTRDICDQSALITAAVYSFSCIGHVHGIEWAAVRQYCPGDTRQFVGKRHHHNVLVSSRQEPLYPAAERRVALSKVRQHCTCPMNQVLTQISIAALADAKQPWLPAGRSLPRDQSEPSGHIAATFKGSSIPHRRH